MLKKLTTYITFGKKKDFEELPPWVLVLLGVPSFLFAGYFGLMFVEVIPKAIETTNKVGLFNKQALAIWTLLGFFGACVWVAACLSKRCHDLLYSSWFK